MKVVSVNTCTYGSTGRIALALCEAVTSDGEIALLAVPGGRHLNDKKQDGIIKIGGRFSEDLHVALGRLTGLQGLFSVFSTIGFLRKLKKQKVDIIHLHNLHNSYINLPLLFSFIKKHSLPTVWTLHDCWAFTGHCPYYDMAGCDKWQTGCSACPLYKKYPKSFVDHSGIMYRMKKRCFSNIPNLTLVTPSEWLGREVKKSFLKDYPVKVINNGIDLSVFRPRQSDFRQKYNCESKFVILGVSFLWDSRKGLDVFIQLSKRLDDRFRIVLVGTNEQLDGTLPENIISIHRTENQQQLAEIYSAADVFVNPTREENYPTVNMEALACGTPVVTFDTGGSPEMVGQGCGCTVAKDDVEAMYQAVLNACIEGSYSRSDCVESARAFDKNDKHRQYLDLYRSII